VDIEAFNKAVAAEWERRVPRPPQLSIADLQDIAHFYFGNPDLGVLHVGAYLEKTSYEWSFLHLGRTPFSIVAACRYDRWLHVALLHVHTAFTGGLPASVGISDLREMRQFAALAYTLAHTQQHLYFASAGAAYSISLDPLMMSLGYTLIECTADKHLTTVRGFMVDYLHPYTEPPEAGEVIRSFHRDIPKA
jgi:hypothetical protein